MGIVGPIVERLVGERERWPLWLPVFLGLGIAVYFGLPAEPPLWLGAVILGLTLGLVALGRRQAVVLYPGLCVAAMALGFFASEWRTHQVTAPVLERRVSATLDGTVVEVEMLAGGGARASLERLSFDKPLDAVPARVRIRLSPKSPVPTAGDRVSVRAVLMPPPQPAAPGAYDFARHAFFDRLGAVGYAIGPTRSLASADPDGWRERARLGVNDLRHRLTARVLAAVPGDGGAVTAALLTGEQEAISKPMMQAYRDSGLAHILSISGLHMSLAAGLVFFVIRGALALWPAVALRWPIKKWAALVAILATFFYMLLAGSPVPAQRSFLMTGIVLVAVLLDRVAISMRMLAWAAAGVVLWEPEELIGPSFQMSFAAVCALIAAYEVLTPRQGAWRHQHPGFMWGAGLYVFGVVVSTLVAGSATAVYGIFHFNRFAVWSVAANAIAVPLTGFWVMPWALLAFLLMPLGLEAWALVPMGWGCEGVNQVAVWVAGWPAAAITLPPLPVWGMGLFTLGLLWLCLWRTRWRLWGVPVMVAALASMAINDPPDLLVDSHGEAFGLRTLAGELLTNRKGGKILRETWVRRAGPESPERWPKAGASGDGSLRCDELGCVWRAKGHTVGLVLDDDALAESCAGNELVVSSVPVRHACRGARWVVDRFDLWREGAHAIWLIENGGIRVETVAGWQGDRPWSHHPKRRKKQAEPVQPTATAEEE
ncbi:MAG: ComEC/Rec2 family competence protein [Actinomycetota bacterium]